MEDTIEHFLLACTRYCRERLLLAAALRVVGVPSLSVKVLLGGGNYVARIQRRIIKATAAYLTSTGRLSVL